VASSGAGCGDPSARRVGGRRARGGRRRLHGRRRRALRGLNVRLRIAAERRPYADGEAERLRELFGPADEWSRTLGSVPWAEATLSAGPFDGATVLDLPVPCTYDFEVAAAKYSVFTATPSAALRGVGIRHSPLSVSPAPAGVTTIWPLVRDGAGPPTISCSMVWGAASKPTQDGDPPVRREAHRLWSARHDVVRGQLQRPRWRECLEAFAADVDARAAVEAQPDRVHGLIGTKGTCALLALVGPEERRRLDVAALRRPADQQDRRAGRHGAGDGRRAGRSEHLALLAQTQTGVAGPDQRVLGRRQREQL